MRASPTTNWSPDTAKNSCRAAQRPKRARDRHSPSIRGLRTCLLRPLLARERRRCVVETRGKAPSGGRTVKCQTWGKVGERKEMIGSMFTLRVKASLGLFSSLVSLHSRCPFYIRHLPFRIVASLSARIFLDSYTPTLEYTSVDRAPSEAVAVLLRDKFPGTHSHSFLIGDPTRSPYRRYTRACNIARSRRSSGKYGAFGTPSSNARERQDEWLEWWL